MVKKIKECYPYFVMQDTSMIDQYCVMVVTGYGFSQQISPWYFRKGNAIRKYNSILKSKTMGILNRE